MTAPDRDYGRDLYPFLYDDPSATEEAALVTVLHEVRHSTLQKCRDTVALRQRLADEYTDQLIDCAAAMASTFAAGGKLLAFGNGGSATDAQDAVADCLMPLHGQWRRLAAMSLVNDVATLTAVANDVGFDHVFARQIAAFGAAGDIALGISTSGNSPNVWLGLSAARQRGLLTIALSGGDGGALARSSDVDFCFVARLEYIPRIQEGHATVWHILLDLTQELLA